MRHDTFWTAVALGARVAGQAVLTLIALTHLQGHDAALWLVFTSLGSLVQLFDLGLSSAVLRSASHLWAGVAQLKPIGMAPGSHTGPNYASLSALSATMRTAYSILAAGVLAGALLVGLWGLGPLLQGLQHWLAWGFFSIGAALQLLSSERSNLLQGAGQLIKSQQLSALGLMLSLGLPAVLIGYTHSLLWGCVGLALGWGIYYFIFCAATRWIARGSFSQKIFASLWPNSWRTGVSRLSLALFYHLPALLLSRLVDIHTGGSYGLSVQVCLLITALCQVPMAAATPRLHQLTAAADIPQLRALFFIKIRQVMLLQMLATGLTLVVGPWALRLIGAQAQLLPMVYLLPLVLFFIAEHHRHNFALLISAFNHVPFWAWDAWGSLAVCLGMWLWVPSAGLLAGLALMWGVQLLGGFWLPVVHGLRLLQSAPWAYCRALFGATAR